MSDKSLDKTEIAEILSTVEPIPENNQEASPIPAPAGQDTPKHSKARPIKISCHKCLQKLDLSSLEPFTRFNCPACNTELIVPEWFDNYLLEEPGGAGGMAIVYRALDLTLDREVAIKVLDPDIASKKERAELFLHEARTAATINHYAVIPIYTCGEFEDRPYMVMQYMNGGSIERRILTARDYLPVYDAVRWIRDVSEGLDNARRHGIMHHDIKPANIMLDSDGNAKIGDFGIAQAMNDYKSKKLFEVTNAWVSPHYVSPEKVETGKEDFAGDVYSLGATFYHIMTGTTPFANNNVNDLINMRLTQNPAPPVSRRKEMPPEISELIMSMMDRDPAKRPQYRDIIKILNVHIKKTESMGTASPANFMNSKTITVSRSAVDRERPNIKSKSPMTKAAIKKHKFKKAAIGILAALVILTIAGLGLILWFILAPQNNSSLKDYLPAATRFFAEGEPQKAAESARKAFENPDASLPARKQAALKIAFGDFLNFDANARSECSFLCERLSVLNVPENDPLFAMIKFLEKPETSPETLLLQVENYKHLVPLARLSIFLRASYDRIDSNKQQALLEDYRKSLPGNPEPYWGFVWKKRVDSWAKYMKSAEGNPDLLEPLIKAKHSDKPRKIPSGKTAALHGSSFGGSTKESAIS